MYSRKIDKNIEERLLSGRIITVLSALNDIKFKGNMSYLPLMFDLLNTRPDSQVEEEILNILGTLKIQAAVPVLVTAIQESEYKLIRGKLTTACWQNGLDFKNYLPVFIDIIIQEEWETGFEAFTVIENMELYPEQEIIDLSVSKINNALPALSDKKRYFLQEILVLIC